MLPERRCSASAIEAFKAFGAEDFLHSVLEAGAGLDGIRQLVQKRFEEKAA